MLVNPTVPAVRPKNHRRLFTLSLLVLIVLFARNASPTSIVAAKQTSSANSVGTIDLQHLTTHLSVRPDAPKPPIYAKNFVLMDGETGDLLVNHQADEPIAIASTTKMVTALTATQVLKNDDVTTVSAKPPTIQGSKIGLLAGEKITVGNLLKGLLISSGNDAAFTLAEAYSGTEGNYQPFVQKMNEFLRANNLTKTTLADPAGLDDDNGRSTARELAHIARLLLKNERLAAIVTTAQDQISSIDGLQVHSLKNTNRLIQNDTSFYLPSALGIKTGYTPAAGHSLVSAYRLNNQLLIGVVMNTTESTNTASAAEMKKLFLWAEDNLIEQNYL